MDIATCAIYQIISLFLMNALVAINGYVGVSICWTRWSICTDEVWERCETVDWLTITEAATQFRHSVVNGRLYVFNSKGGKNFLCASVSDRISISATTCFSTVDKPGWVFGKLFFPTVKGPRPSGSPLDTWHSGVIWYSIELGLVRMWAWSTSSNPEEVPVSSIRSLLGHFSFSFQRVNSSSKFT